MTKNSENVVCHFYREETFRCKIMDKHLAILAKKHVETKFCKVITTLNILSKMIVLHEWHDNNIMQCYCIHVCAHKHVYTLYVQQMNPLSLSPSQIDAEKTPFLCDRLKIRTIPTVILIKDSVTRGYIVGFTDLGNTDEFSTEMLAWRLGHVSLSFLFASF